MAISPGGRPADDSPIGTPGGKQNWLDKVGGLPKYIREVAHALLRKGWTKQRAIATAVTRMKVWAAGGENVSPKVQAAAAAALAEWESKRGASHVMKNDIVKGLREEVASDPNIVKFMVSNLSVKEKPVKKSEKKPTKKISKREVTLTKKEFNEAAKLVESVSGSVSKKKDDKTDLTMQGAISKVDNEKKRVFGWASVGIRKDGQVVIDKQGDLIDDPAEMEDAAYNFVLHSRDGGEMHIRKGVSTLIESFVITPEKAKALGIPDGILPQSAWWTGWQVHDDDVWKGVKSGKYKMFSVHGRGTRKRVDA